MEFLKARGVVKTWKLSVVGYEYFLALPKYFNKMLTQSNILKLITIVLLSRCFKLVSFSTL